MNTRALKKKKSVRDRMMQLGEEGGHDTQF